MTRRPETGAGAVAPLLALLLLVVGLAALNYPLYDHVRDQRVLEQTGVVSSASVLTTEVQGEAGEETYAVVWQLGEAGGERRSEVDEETYRVAENERTVEVRYPEGEPEVAYAVGRTSDPDAPTWVLGADAALLVLLVLLAATVGRRRVRGAADRFLGTSRQHEESDVTR
ncbi:hypothetical protein KLP28_06200 [Nocardioidaceae bacterium]|nr:hypothetical protein KLP28_06200 [Nocardioidaceae bacterium]